VQRRFGRSEYRRAVAEYGRQVIATPAGTGMLPPRIRKRGGSSSPSPMTHGARKSAYLAQSPSGRVTARQSRRLVHKHRADTGSRVVPALT
jgi:hypothetical protein